jgi:ArsR family transcriptional regulator
MAAALGQASTGLCREPAGSEAEVDFRPIEGSEADKELAKLAQAIGHSARVRILRMRSPKEVPVCRRIVDDLPLAQSIFSRSTSVP